MNARPGRPWVRSRDLADAVAQWAAVRDDAFAREVDALLADLFPEEESRG